MDNLGTVLSSYRHNSKITIPQVATKASSTKVYKSSRSLCEDSKALPYMTLLQIFELFLDTHPRVREDSPYITINICIGLLLAPTLRNSQLQQPDGFKVERHMHN